MKKIRRIRHLPVILTAFILVLLLSACGKNSVVGVWEATGEDAGEYYMIFNRDGTVESDTEYIGTYEVSENHLTMMGDNGEAIIFDMELDGDIMILSFTDTSDIFPETSTTRLHRVSSMERKDVIKEKEDSGSETVRASETQKPSATPKPTKSAKPTATAKPVSTPAPTSATTAAPKSTAKPAAASSETFVIKNLYISMEAPVAIQDKIETEMSYLMGSAPTINFYQTRQHEREQGGGLLFSVAVFAMNDDSYLDLPSTDVFGTLTSSEGDYRVIIYYPSDYQSAPDTVDEYNALLTYKDQILTSMKGINGYQLSR